MKYIIQVFSVGENKFSYRIETQEKYVRDISGMADGILSTGFFSTKEEAINVARRSLLRAGIKDEDIIV